jgi:hypothetical protein
LTTQPSVNQKNLLEEVEYRLGEHILELRLSGTAGRDSHWLIPRGEAK